LQTFPSAKDIFQIEGNTFSTGTLFTNVRVYALVPFFRGTLKKGDYQTGFIPVLEKGFPIIVQFDFTILYEVFRMGRVTIEQIET